MTHKRRLTLSVAAWVGLLTTYSLGTVLFPAARIDVLEPSLRIVLEVGGLSVVLFAALVLAFPPDADVRPARNAIVAALCVLAVSNAVFGVLPFLDGQPGRLGVGLRFIPWIAARYVAGLLFVIGALERPRLGLYQAVGFGFALLLATILVLAMVFQRLPLPFTLVSEDPFRVVVASVAGHAVVEAVPAVLFAVGAYLSGRLYVRTARPLYEFVALALVVQVFTQLHEVLYPALLGPRITSADILRSTAFALLLYGALLQVRALYRDRGLVLRAQERDLRDQDALLEEMRRFADREEDFRTLVTHELATPLATLRAFAHVLEDVPAVTDDRNAREALEGIGSESRRLLELVERMEELRDLELSGFHCDLRPVRIGPLLHDVARYARGLPGRHPVTVDCEEARVSADPVRLGQALRNIVGNAARYSPDGTPIMIDGRHAEGDRFRIVITDAGPGIPPQQRVRITEKYARGPDSTGTGLGLYVARRIAEAHGGYLRVDAPSRSPATQAGGREGTQVVLELGSNP